MIHEISHLLGMSNQLFAHWHDSNTGFPRTQRPFQWYCGSAVPDETTMRLSADVMHSEPHYEIVTPTVKAVVQNQFNCSSSDIGGRLEGGRCFGSHWDAVGVFYIYCVCVCLSLLQLTYFILVALVSDRTNERWRSCPVSLSIRSHLCRL